MGKRIASRILVPLAWILALFGTSFWLIGDITGTGPEPIALAGIAMTLGVAFSVGGSIGQGSIDQQKSLTFIGKLFLISMFGFIAIAIILPPFKTWQPDSWLYQPLIFTNGIMNHMLDGRDLETAFDLGNRVAT